MFADLIDPLKRLMGFDDEKLSCKVNNYLFKYSSFWTYIVI